ncbi:propionate CoA-transferase [Desulfotomaculum arcticum]|uniref:Propionate CoA-transferase n=1 Tax=Desulfotruncus arcticus DSM 17038 TaxID=1121424 RepID=A0A1I2YFV8_9FIRM|nr:malonate decarboxylase subunit alpha [Desulfotruncus arcticus]SFH24534.1 propionate CoA-transferase [Desulfotomaculum arcticum] [Desulfotruncus arcticus DSM 17038]
MAPEFLSPEDAVKIIKDDDLLVIEGAGGGLLEAGALIAALAQRYKATQTPKNLTLVHVSGIGDNHELGLNQLALPGLLKRAIGGHWGMAPKMCAFAANEEVEAFNLPQGVLSQLMREIAGGRLGLVTHVGLRTFIDPRVEGGKLNQKAKESEVNLVELININGQERLFYPVFSPNVAFIKGSTADEKGNISFEKEPAYLEALSVAQATKNKGGKVIVQVQRVAQAKSIDPHYVKIPGNLVDIIVVDPGQWQTVDGQYNPGLSGEIRIPISSIPPLELSERKIIARRAAMEVTPGLINIGMGMPDGIANVAAEEGFYDRITFCIEQGIYGGVPAGGVIFGTTYNPEVFIDAPYQFDFFDGGGLDIACLGMAQVDHKGNVNVSKIGKRIIGTGGFVNISQNAKKVVFCGTFMGGGLKVNVNDGSLQIINEGKYQKFVNDVDQITFSGEYAVFSGQQVLYVTERAVFQLTAQGVELIEIAPGIDMHRDILDKLTFNPQISSNLKTMDKCIFKEEPMGLHAD